MDKEFDWSKYDENYQGGNRLSQNLKIKGQDNKQKCYSREPYAQEMFDLLTSSDSTVIRKDLVKGDCVTITDIYNIRDCKMTVELSGGLSVEIDLGREKRFVQLFGYDTVDSFVRALQSSGTLKGFVDEGLSAYVIESSPAIKISLWQGHLMKIRDEFMKEITSPSKAYVAKVLEANKGGYFVEVQGLDAFMPGSLAAPNKIIDFQSLVGKEVIVMIEDFLTEMNSFIVSHKKYIEHVLPKKIQELDLKQEFSGTVTGASKYGVFVEFDDIFTGLLHRSKMKSETLRIFNARGYKPGDDIKFFINEITKDNRIILTEESPIEKEEKINQFVEEYSDKIFEGEVAAVMNFGIIVNVGELSGLIPNKEFRRRKASIKNFIVGDKMSLTFAELKDEKLVFNLYAEEKND